MSNRKALITGSGRGIGRGIAERLADDGFDIAVVDVEASTDNIGNVVEAVKAKGRNAVGLTGDVSKPDDVARFTSEAADRPRPWNSPSTRSPSMRTRPASSAPICGI